jgi:ERCC4-type nuclease
VPSNGGAFLAYAKDFRRIIESDATLNEQIERIKQLRSNSEEYARVVGKLGHRFPEEWFWSRFTIIPRVGAHAAENLFRAGYKSLQDLREASADELQKVKGIGPKSAAAILEWSGQ